jgi:hypothetical protein
MIRAAIYGHLGGNWVEPTARSGKAMVPTSVAVEAARFGEFGEPVRISTVAFAKAGDQHSRHAHHADETRCPRRRAAVQAGRPCAVVRRQGARRLGRLDHEPASVHSTSELRAITAAEVAT